MNCRQARGLFSSRVDNELSPQDALRLQDHLDACAECSLGWDSFERTVRMVRSLPQVAPDADFVGQVLDRVRGYEAESRTARESRLGLMDRLRAAVEPLFDVGFWSRLLIPARLAGAVAFGIAAGFVVTESHLIPAPAFQTVIAHGAAVAVPNAHRQVTAAAPRAQRPFADLVDVAEGRSDSTAMRANNRTAPNVVHESGTGPGRQVNLSTSDGRPQITF